MPKLASSLLFGTGYVDWQERINVSRLREERAERLRQTMKKHGVAALLITQGEDMRYATGLRVPVFTGQLNYCLFSAEHETVHWIHAGYYEQWKDQVPWIKPENWRIGRSWLGEICGVDATREEAKLFAAETAQELKEKGLTGEKIGVTGFDLPGIEALNEVGIETFSARPLVLEARAVKQPNEILCIKMSAAIADIGFYKIWEALKPGVRDVDVSAAGVKAMMEASADHPGQVAVFSGPNTFERGFETTDRIIQVGDMVYCDIAMVKFLGYHTCYYRCFIVGRKPNDKEKDWHKQVLEKQNAVIDAIKPGATTADAAKHFPPANKWGYPDEVYVLTMEIGHGRGLSLYEMPVINRQWSLKHPQVFEVGNSMSIESREGEWRVGGARLEDMIIVTENGAEIVGRMPRDEIIVAGAVV